MNDFYNLQRFITAQNPVYPHVCTELRNGYKTSHWMWFIFPQIRGLGHSAMANKFAISSIEEARAYLDHPILGNRLRECTQLVIQIEGRTIRQIFGSPDDLKFASSMTLFAMATPNNPDFEKALQKYFAGKYDQLTVELLSRVDD
ncbi:MAG: DUF1810 domain-containing protein [Methylobacter sp.]